MIRDLRPPSRHPARMVLAVALALVPLLGTAGCGGSPVPAPDPAYLAEIESYRTDRSEGLRREDGWLSLAGLFWLDEGETPFGTDPSNPIVLPPGSAPPHAGVFVREAERVTLVADPDSGITLAGEPVSRHDFDPAVPEGEEVLRLGRLSFHLIRRDGRPAVRLKDPQSPALLNFAGLDFFPIDPRFRLEARLEPYPESRERVVQTVSGTEARFLAVGELEFDLDGTRFSLEALLEEPSDDEYFIIFKDLTSGGSTYGAGRYLRVPRTESGVILDFNRAYNPPCAFTPYATCPLPPPGNRLEIAIEAGEKAYRHS